MTPDTRFFETLAPMPLAALIELTGCDLVHGDAEATLAGVAACGANDSSDRVVYCESAQHVKALGENDFGLCITTPELAKSLRPSGAIAATPRDMPENSERIVTPNHPPAPQANPHQR